MAKMEDKVLDSVEFELPIMAVLQLVKMLVAEGIEVQRITFRTQDLEKGLLQDVSLDLGDDDDLDPLSELDEDMSQ